MDGPSSLRRAGAFLFGEHSNPVTGLRILSVPKLSSDGRTNTYLMTCTFPLRSRLVVLEGVLNTPVRSDDGPTRMERGTRNSVSSI